MSSELMELYVYSEEDLMQFEHVPWQKREPLVKTEVETDSRLR